MGCRKCFFFNDTATTEIYTLSLHDALPICESASTSVSESLNVTSETDSDLGEITDAISPDSTASTSSSTEQTGDRKSTRLNSSHANISYAVFCLKKKKKSEIGIAHF